MNDQFPSMYDIAAYLLAFCRSCMPSEGRQTIHTNPVKPARQNERDYKALVQGGPARPYRTAHRELRKQF